MSIDVKTAVKEYGVSLANLPLLPKQSSITGKYTDRGGRVRSYKGKRTLFSRQEAANWALSSLRNVGTMQRRNARSSVTCAQHRCLSLIQRPILLIAEGNVWAAYWHPMKTRIRIPASPVRLAYPTASTWLVAMT